MEVRSGGPASLADQSDNLAHTDVLADVSVDGAEMGIDRLNAVAVIDDDMSAVAPGDLASVGHSAWHHRDYRCAGVGSNVEAGVNGHVGIVRRTEFESGRTVHGPLDLHIGVGVSAGGGVFDLDITGKLSSGYLSGMIDCLVGGRGEWRGGGGRDG